MEGPRFRADVAIAVCALLASSLAALASVWQARASYEQTALIAQQLGAQVWPFVSIGESYDGSGTVKIALTNEGLGPAVLRNLQLSVDGKPEPGFVALLHAVVGVHVERRDPNVALDLSYEGPGDVIRPGQSLTAFRIASRTFGKAFFAGYGRVRIRACFCAIVPGECWEADSVSDREPQRVAVCPNIPTDALHHGTSNRDLSDI